MAVSSNQRRAYARNSMKYSARQRRGGKRTGGVGGPRHQIAKAGSTDVVDILFFRGLYKIPVIDIEGKDKVVELPYDLKCQHYSARVNKGLPFLTCTAGLREFEDPETGEIFIDAGDSDCVPCYYFYQEGREGPISNPRKIHIFNAILLAWFHKVPGDRPIKGKSGEFWPEYKKCAGPRCVHCKAGLEKTYGRRVYIPLGPVFATNLADYQMVTLNSMCQCGGDLQPVGFSCSNPNCGYPIKDLEEEGCTDDELKSLREDLHRCPKCHEYVELEESSVCTREDCAGPKPISMWDVAMKIYRSGEQTSTTLVISGVRKITERERTLIKDLMVPIDTNKVFPVYSLEEQARRFWVDNPFGETERSRGYGDYGNDDEELPPPPDDDDIPF